MTEGDQTANLNPQKPRKPRKKAKHSKGWWEEEKGPNNTDHTHTECGCVDRQHVSNSLGAVAVDKIGIKVNAHKTLALQQCVGNLHESRAALDHHVSGAFGLELRGGDGNTGTACAEVAVAERRGNRRRMSVRRRGTDIRNGMDRRQAYR